MSKSKGAAKGKAKFVRHYETPESLQRIWAFLEARDKGKYPEPVFLEWIEKCLRSWNKSQGKTSLDVIMELKSTTKGEPPPFKQAHLAYRNNLLLRDIAALIAHGFEINEAAKAVSAKLAASNYRESEWGTAPTLSWEHLTDMYEGWMGREEAEEYYKGCGNPEYYKSFPKETIPERYKKGKK